MNRFRTHIRSNLVAYLALVVAMSGTGAWAADKITSRDIAKNAIRPKHIRANAVTEPKIANGSITPSKLSADVDNTLILWANVQNDFGTATLIRGKGVTAVQPGGSGEVRVSFIRGVRDCTYQATGWLNPDTGATYVRGPIMVAEQGPGITANVVEVHAYDGDTGNIDTSGNYDFTVAVFC